MANSNYRGDWNRDRDERWGSGEHREHYRNPFAQRGRDEDDARRAGESMERDHYGNEGRGGYGGRAEREGSGTRHGSDYNRGYGPGDYQGDYKGDYEQNYGRRDSDPYQSGRFSEGGHGRGRDYSSSESHRHHGNEMGGWEGREDEQWRNREAHGQYDRDTNRGGFSRYGSYRGGEGYGREGGRRGDWSGRGYDQPYGGGYGQNYRQNYRERSYDQRSYGQGSSGRPSGGHAYGEYSGSPSGYFGDDTEGAYSEVRRQGRWQGSSQGTQSCPRGQDYGQYRGRGPRGYKRSDERIREEVCDCLTDDDGLDASNIEIVVKDGEVTLTGVVTSRDDKRWAEALAERISGVKEVQNSLRVQDQQRTQSTAQSSSSQSGSQAGSQTQATGATATSGSSTSATGRDKGKESNIQH